MKTNVEGRGRQSQIIGAILFLVGFVISPVACFSDSQTPSAIMLVAVTVGGLLYIVGKLQSA